MSWSEWAQGELAAVRQAQRWRQTRAFDALGPAGVLGERRVVSFASNDYLGLSTHPAVTRAAHEAIDRWGTGATASRLIVGTRPCHDELEVALADWKHAQRSLVFASGFAANLGVLSAFGGSDVTVLSDELNHASIIDGCRLSRSHVVVYRHNDLDHLDHLLGEQRSRRLVVTESVFSMDGDVVPLAELMTCCARHDALLVLDEAHAVLGPHLRADADEAEVVRVGTMSKTLGALGGWVAGPSPLIDLLVNRARPFIFTTALTPADTAAALAAVRICRTSEGERLQARLASLIDRVRPGHPSPIVPLIVGDETAALAASEALLEQGIFVPAIRPPTVPPGTSRLRIALSAAHTDEMLDQLTRSLAVVAAHLR